MEELERTRTRLGTAATAAILFAGVLLLSTGCASSKKKQPASLPPQTVARVQPQPQPPSEPPVAAAVKDDSVVEIGSPEPAPPPEKDMVAVAKAERERRKNAPPPIAVITNANLKQHATGKLTYVDKPLDEEAREKSGNPDAMKPSKDPGTSSDAAVKEEYWRSKVLEARLRWRDAVDSIEKLQQKVADLREKFYAEDDPYRRDSEIKPAWDLALSELESAREESKAARTDLENLLEEGRKAGALPGWLREGLEYEPKTQKSSDDLPTVEPGEPETVEEHEP